MNHGRWIEDSQAKWLTKRPCQTEAKFFSDFCAIANLHQRKSYTWRPTYGNIEEFSHQRFCAILGGRDILVVGDSLNQEFFHTVVAAMLDNDTSLNTTARCAMEPPWRERTSVWSELLPCAPPWAPINISFVWSHHLLLKEEEKIQGGKVVVLDAAWVEALAKHNYNVLFINTGMHYHPEMPRNVMEAISHITSAHSNVSVVYRFAPPGHVGCETEFHSSPLLMAQNESVYALDGKYPNHRSHSYHWFDVVAQNYEVDDMLHSRFPHVVHLNVVNSTILRIDSHVIKTGRWIPEDCLHYCIPGPIDQWVTFFFNALEKISTWK